MAGKPEYEIMQTAWRERNPQARIKAAKDAIGLNPECATAYILLAEEEVRVHRVLVRKSTVFIFRPETSPRRRSSSRKPSGSRRLTTGDPSSYSIRTN